jgi:hypothetical protein
MLEMKFKMACSVNLIHWSVVQWRARKPNWLALSRPLSSLCLLTLFRITFSNSLPVIDKRLIGRKFLGNFGSLPGFGNVITFASFYDFGNWHNRRQWLNKRVRYNSGLLGRCRRHSFGIPSSPQAFLNFNGLSNLCLISQGLTFPNGVPSTVASRASTLVSTRCSWFSSRMSWDVK